MQEISDCPTRDGCPLRRQRARSSENAVGRDESRLEYRNLEGESNEKGTGGKEEAMTANPGSNITTKFRRQVGWGLVAVLIVQVGFAVCVTAVRGWNLYWALPVLILLILPYFLNRRERTVDERGISFGPKEQLAWNEIEKVEKASENWLVFLLKNGTTRILTLADWPEKSCHSLFDALEERGMKIERLEL